MRPPTACVACRTRKRKCDIPPAYSECTYCTSQNLSCSLAPRGDPRDHSRFHGVLSPILSTQSWTPPATQHERMPSLHLCEELISLYFRYIHDTFHSLFHQPSLLEDVRHGQVPQIILLSIISLASRFSDDDFFGGTDPRDRGRPYAAEAAQLLDLRDISVTTIQASVLLGAFAITEGEAEAESIYYSIASRLAMLMDLPNMPVTSRLEQETNIRLWWTLNMIDVWSSNGVGLPRSITPRPDVPYPMEETAFLQLRRNDYAAPYDNTDRNSDFSLLAQMVKLNAILFEVSEMNRMAISNTSKPHLSAEAYDAAVDALGQKLDTWYKTLPRKLEDTPENLERYANAGLGHIFVAVYLGYYHYGQLLYYQYLDSNIFADELAHNPTLASRAAGYAEKCKHFSTSLCSILYRCYSIPGCEVYYTMVGHVLVVASTIQLFILLFSSSELDTSLARERLTRNFGILTKLQQFWPTLDRSFERFREFHETCLRETEGRGEGSFRMDRWMLGFLYEFARPVSKREGGAGGVWVGGVGVGGGSGGFRMAM